jgi:2-polyprenyl-3-methyl-5-hydroxy-6-metoxy-1,4-benzoquinol methylase
MIGKQTEGSSAEEIYQMALRTIEEKDISDESILDVGGGKGNLAMKLLERGATDVTLLDHDPSLGWEEVEEKKCDLNNEWPVEDEHFDRVFGVEVIEHLENPRFFFRELKRVLKEGGEAFISTPNIESLFSKLCFLVKGKHRYFQDSCYPAHITPVSLHDIKRICNEQNFYLVNVLYSSHTNIPKSGVEVRFGGKLMSDNMGVVVKR